MSTLLTYPTKTTIDLAALSPNDIHLVDIAHHLSLINRYCGGTPEAWNDAQHSVLVSYLCPPEYALEGLFHDAEEYLTNDVPGPVKHMDLCVGFRQVGDAIAQVIAAKFDLIWPFPKEVKEADHNAYLFEDFLLRQGKEYPEIVVPEEFLTAWPAKHAEQRFLRRYAELVQNR